MQKTAPASSESEDPDFLEWQHEFQTKRRRVLNAPGVEQGLSRLAAKGTDKDKLLSLLVMSCPTPNPEDLRDEVKRRIKGLRSLARQMESAADELDSTFAHDVGFAETWKYLLFPITFKRFPDFTVARAAIALRSKSIRNTARFLRRESSLFARLAKYYPGLNDNNYLAIMLGYVYESTGQYHERTLAAILSSAHGELGADVDYSEERLHKFRQRDPVLKKLVRSKRALISTADMLANLYGGLWDETNGTNES